MGLDHFQVSIAKVTAAFDGGCESVSGKESTELSVGSDLNNRVNCPNDGYGISTCVATFQRATGLENLVSYGLRNLTQHDESGAGYMKNDDETFLIVTSAQGSRGNYISFSPIKRQLWGETHS